MHTLPATPKQPPLIRWAVLAMSLSVLALVVYVVWSGVSASHRADDALATLQRHDAAARSRAARVATQDERARRLDAQNQRALLGYVKALAAQQAAENAWLRSHHIPIPDRLVAVVPPPRIVVRHHHAHRSGTRHRTSSTSTTPRGPGKSGGHRKHPKRHRH